MIKPQGRCFWLTIDLPGLRGGAGRCPLDGRLPSGREADVVEARPERALEVPVLADGLDDVGLRWAMDLPSVASHDRARPGSVTI
jgi:hypothetical protein